LKVCEECSVEGGSVK